MIPVPVRTFPTQLTYRPKARLKEHGHGNNNLIPPKYAKVNYQPAAMGIDFDISVPNLYFVSYFHFFTKSIKLLSKLSLLRQPGS